VGEEIMQEIVFSEPKENHYYAKRNDKGQLELVEEPQKGESYFEFAAIAGGC
jgi:hypothetical protein